MELCVSLVSKSQSWSPVLNYTLLENFKLVYIFRDPLIPEGAVYSKI